MKPPGSSIPPVLARRSSLRQFGVIAACLLGVLLVLFWKDLNPDYAVFANDGNLGAISARFGDLPSGLFAVWQDLNWLGGAGPAGIPSVTIMLNMVFGHLIYAKIYAPFAIFFVGLGAWFCFRQWKFSPAVCLLGGLAAALNSDFLSTACWGVASQTIGFGLDFLALAALADQTSPRRWIRVALAGMAVGMSIMEAFDIGAIFSVFVALFAVFQALNQAGPPAKKLARGIVRTGLVAAFAAFLAAGALISLVSTQVKGVAGMEQDEASKAQRWNEATLWSLPKKETLGLGVPGLFGFRMDTPKDIATFPGLFEGGQYWGAVAQDPSFDQYIAAKHAGQQVSPPMARYSGGGSYTGVLVLVIALWGVVQSFRKGNGVYSIIERRFIWFWLGVTGVSLLMAYGRHAPLYQVFYALPYASTIRNPAKFIHVVCWALVILFAYGLEGLGRLCLQGTAATGSGPMLGLGAQWKAWWGKASAVDRRWVRWSVIAVGASLFAWVVYASSKDRLIAYLQDVDFDAASAEAIAGFSLRQVGWFILLLVLALGLVAVVLSGYFNGRRAKTGFVLIGLLLTADLMASNLPWVIIYNWKQNYASNPVLDFLAKKPYEQRVSIAPFPPLNQLVQLDRLPQEELQRVVKVMQTMHFLYRGEWLQHLFQYYNIQSPDVYMMPRQPIDYKAFEGVLQPRPARHWELTSTRYLFAPANLGPLPWTDLLNAWLDPAQKRFKVALRFDVVPKPGVTQLHGYGEEYTAVLNTNGASALIEFTGALPRAKLYTNWQVSTNTETTLKELANPAFDPAKTVLVTEPVVGAPPAAQAGASQPGSVEIVSYAPKQIQLRANATAPSVLMLDDRFDADWKVTVDGKPATLLHCDYVMRGVQVPQGSHQVEFQFQPSTKGLKISLSAIALGVLMLGFLCVARGKETAT